jgi:hypothetical protein
VDINRLINKILTEATSTSSGSRGSFIPPLQPGLKPFEKQTLDPYNISVSDYKNPLVQYDSYDKDWDLRKNQIKDLEKIARKVQKGMKKHPEMSTSDEDGNPINQYMLDGMIPNKKEKVAPYINKVSGRKKLKESAYTSMTAGEYSGPQELGMKKWKESELGPFTDESDIDINQKIKKKTTKKNIRRIVGMWEKDRNGSYDVPTYDVDSYKQKKINEDLAVWFGKKKKPKGSKQPKGPWVDICRKVNGKHPPCGRSDSDTGSYPKCRAAGVAGKMSDSAKRAACQQKRRAEKQDTQTGKGQKPIMTSYKPRKNKNENMKTRIINLTEETITRIVKRIIREQISGELPKERLDVVCTYYNLGEQRGFYDMVAVGGLFKTSFGQGFRIKKNPQSKIPSDVIGGTSSGSYVLAIEPATDVLIEYFKKRFPNVDFDKTQLKNILYMEDMMSGQQGFCTTTRDTDAKWLDFFDQNNVMYKIS